MNFVDTKSICLYSDETKRLVSFRDLEHFVAFWKLRDQDQVLCLPVTVIMDQILALDVGRTDRAWKINDAAMTKLGASIVSVAPALLYSFY